ncbi:cGMP-specific 3',5'-cyclic phosphodiesterase isoform X2 [Hydra vulgaris]|uniref:Phosphodiesterase n=1 Tax=Hydra vulgaris TaxID=6087 RepID=A0ABM4BKJ6_HYDVU
MAEVFKTVSDWKEVTEILNKNPEYTREYFLEHASGKMVEEWVMQRSHLLNFPEIKTVVTKSDYTLKPIPSNLTKFLKNNELNNANELAVNNKKKNFEQLLQLSEKDLLMELIRDIAHELDVDSLSHKILVNVCLLTNCDRSSLFLVKGQENAKYLISRLFDVTALSTLEQSIKSHEDAIIIPIGVGIAGHVAETGQEINIPDAYKDTRFNPSIDRDTGYKTHSILCMPIKNQDNKVVGVAQIINKKEKNPVFTKKDEEVFKNYLTFCGIGLTNAQLFDLSLQEHNRNQVLLNLAKGIFEDTEHLDVVVRRIMTQVQDMLKCERCTVYIINKTKLEESGEIQFAEVFDLIYQDVSPVVVSKEYWQDVAEASSNEKKVYVGFAMLVAKNGKCMNIDNFSKSDIPGKDNLDNSSFKPRCMLCCPIYNNHHEVIGVAQLLNKIGSYSFDENDEALFEGFVIFCGLGIHNTQMYEKATMLIARQKVNTEILQYHAAEPIEGVEEFAILEVPAAESFSFNSFAFDDLTMTDRETCLMTMRIFLEKNFLSTFNIPYTTMCKFVLTVKKNYRRVTYHNWRHAFNVTQTMFTILSIGQMFSWFTDLESFVLLVACLCHDLDHRGTNNNFQLKTQSPIAALYGTSTMERHHFNHSIMILTTDGTQIFDSLNPNDYKLAIKILEDAILSTDLALYFKKRTDFTKIAESQQANWTIFENRGILRGMMMTACDVAAITKPWEVQQRVAEFVANEFFEQGDQERSKLSAEPIPMMDRGKHRDLPKMQVGFIDFVCMPIYKVFYAINPLLKPLYDGVSDNRKNWQSIADTYVPKSLKESAVVLNGTNCEKIDDKPLKKVTFFEAKNSKTCSML